MQKFDKSLGCGSKDWDYKDVGILDKTHLRFFTYKSLLNMFERLNYEVVSIVGLRPTHSTSFGLINCVLFNRLSDAQYHQFACVIRPAGNKDG